MSALPTPHGELALPAFLPDATRAAVRSLEAQELRACGIDALMVNALHLATQPGASVLSALGGIHGFMGWDGPVASDSGGFQIFSLLQQSASLGSLSSGGFTYRLAKGQAKRNLTPRRCIQIQFRLGADILFCLDHCTHPHHPPDRQRESVENTVRWARECKSEFERYLERRSWPGPRPLLFAIIQGGADAGLRRECAERLLEIGFDGYGYGGWPIDRHGQLVEAVPQVAQLVPRGIPKHALGIGKPENLVRCFDWSYDLFDCTLPTRDARRGRLYVFNGPPATLNLRDEFYHYVYAEDKKHVREGSPIDETCDCLCCRRYSRAYVRHLFAVRDPLAYRLATLHNLTFYAQLIALLRAQRHTL
ncbi:MAG: tRNA-ribosyltransferase family protein [Candidatus Zipacnadales bacterium]